jgi:DNA helicase-2/ATP-dependent DNA helicase PcrA
MNFRVSKMILDDSAITLRPRQQDILSYASGRMGISAVPGSGKTWTLSLLAADLITRGVLQDDQEILIVTLVNSAVDNFYQRISTFIQKRGLIPNIGYRVRTLHGLAHDIVRERPELLGLDNNFQILDEHEGDAIRNEVAQTWLQSHSSSLDEYLDPEVDEGKSEWIRREPLPELIKGIALSLIRYAKDMQLTPEQLKLKLDALPVPLPLAEMGWEMYANYQRALNYRGAVDFDDLIRLAIYALDWDARLLERLRFRWPYVLEDEAQDSSWLQEQILQRLVSPDGNWVRVGDPNQAIYETFTTANPRYLRNFINEPGVMRRELPNSGRSTQSIIRLANYLVHWTQNEHPLPEARDALQSPPDIEPTPPDDPQPNPEDKLTHIRLVTRKFGPVEEVQAIIDSLSRWLPEHTNNTVAVLAPRNQRAFDLVDELRKRGLPYHDGLLRSSSSTRFSAGALGNILNYLADSRSPRKLATAYKVWRRSDRENEETKVRLEHTVEILRKVNHVEDFLWPGPQGDWLEESGLADKAPAIYQHLLEFREIARRWHSSILLPVDQIVLTLSQDLLTEPTELAVAHKLAVLLRRISDDNPHWRLPELAGELAIIARNERRFLGFSDDDSGFDPEKYRGIVVVSTMHKAKGLEWDRVYLMSVNNYDFPSGMEYDQYISEKWFIRDRLNLEAETLAQLQILLTNDVYEWYTEGVATQQARLDYVRERLRLLYVGITRAKKELIITWNTGRQGNLQPAIPLIALQSFQERVREVEK